MLRRPILGSYVALTGCDLSEAKLEEVDAYKSLSDLFERQLKWDSRPINRDTDLVSPCDGRVLYCGKVVDGRIDQVKGVNFSLEGFLGRDLKFWDGGLEGDKGMTKEGLIEAHTEARPTGTLFYCTIYLAPGDYHRFHAPTECDLSYRRYFPGKLLSVNPMLARFVPGLFSVNERVAYFGRWRHGRFSLTAVGATDVGNIRVFCDPTVPLNRDKQKLDLIGRRKEGEAFKARRNEPVTWEKPLTPEVRLSRGQLFGKFNLGSTIVLIFEAPHEFQWTIAPGQTVKMGTAIGGVLDAADTAP